MFLMKIIGKEHFHYPKLFIPSHVKSSSRNKIVILYQTNTSLEPAIFYNRHLSEANFLWWKDLVRTEENDSTLVGAIPDVCAKKGLNQY